MQQKIENKQARVDLINNKAALIAAALGGSIERPASLDCDWNARVKLSAGSLSFRYDSYKHRFTIHGSWPSSKNGRCVVPSDVLNYNERKAGVPTTEISVDADEDCGKIAADIQRRLLPNYLSLYGRCLDSIKKSEDYAANSKSNADKVAAAVGSRAVRHSDSEFEINLPHRGKTYGDFTVRGDSVQLNIRGLNVEQAVVLAEFLKTL